MAKPCEVWACVSVVEFTWTTPPKDQEVEQEHMRVMRSWVRWNYVVCVYGEISVEPVQLAYADREDSKLSYQSIVKVMCCVLNSVLS